MVDNQQQLNDQINAESDVAVAGFFAPPYLQQEDGTLRQVECPSYFFTKGDEVAERAAKHAAYLDHHFANWPLKVKV